MDDEELVYLMLTFNYVIMLKITIVNAMNAMNAICVENNT